MPLSFAIIARSCAPFHARTLEERPLGGTETGVIRLAEELHGRGHQVAVFTRAERPPASEPHYLPINALRLIGAVDVVISVREWQPLLAGINAKKKLFWTGDAYDQPHSLGLGDRRVAEQIDAFLAVSEWHADTLCERSGFPREKAWVIGNGVHLDYFAQPVQKKRKRLIYSSTPYRGLNYLPQIFQVVKTRHPDAELHVFSSYDVYAGAGEYPQSVLQEFKQLCAALEKIPGCHLHGSVTQETLAKEFMESSILAYPNTFAETSCITAMEAQAAGCAIVTTELGALPETVGGAGVLIPGNPGEPRYIEQFVAAVDRLLSDDSYFQLLTRRGTERARQEFDWSRVAARLEEKLGQSTDQPQKVSG